MGKKQEWRRKPCWGVQLSHLPFSTLPALQKPSPLLNLWNPFKQIFMIICLWRLSFILNPMFIFLWFSDGKHVTPRNVFLQTSGILIPVLWHTGVGRSSLQICTFHSSRHIFMWEYPPKIHTMKTHIYISNFLHKNGRIF